LLTCTSRLFAFPSRLLRGLLAPPRASNKPSHLFSGVWASRYSRLYDFLSQTVPDRACLKQQSSLCSPVLAWRTPIWRRTRSLRYTPLHSTAATSPRRAFSSQIATRRPPSKFTSPSRGCLRANTFPTDLSCTKFCFYLRLLNPQSYRCPSASKLGRSDGCCVRW